MFRHHSIQIILSYHRRTRGVGDITRYRLGGCYYFNRPQVNIPIPFIHLHSMDESVSTSATTIRGLHTDALTSVSAPSSPRSSALPSPPDSPSTDSVSSFPSVSSSFFFSSAAASPPHSRPQSDETRDSTQGLIIPSLTLPAALRRPTPYGQTLGDLRLLVLESEGAGKNFSTGLLLEDNDDVVDVDQWEDAEYGRVLRASTDWVEHRDAHGLEKFEPTRNVEIVELLGYDHTTDVHHLPY
jgi:hypothetical protein